MGARETSATCRRAELTAQSRVARYAPERPRTPSRQMVACRCSGPRCDSTRFWVGIVDDMASYELNESAVVRARQLIEARQYVLESDWGEVQPDDEAQNAYLKRHSWEEYAMWHLGLTHGANDETKARHAFVFGDFRRVHRSALIACVYRASEWRHKAVELAAHELLQRLDKTAGIA